MPPSYDKLIRLFPSLNSVSVNYPNHDPKKYLPPVEVAEMKLEPMARENKFLKSLLEKEVTMALTLAPTRILVFVRLISFRSQFSTYVLGAIC